MATIAAMQAFKTAANSKRYKKAQKAHGFKSSLFTFARTRGKDNREGVRILRKVYKDSFDNDVSANWQLKKPLGGRLEPEILSGTAIDIYYGKDAVSQPDNIDANHVVRHSYASGSGNNTIGQNPKTRQLKPWKPEFDRLLEIGIKSLQATKELYSEEEKEEIITKLRNCNAASAKWYFEVDGTDAVPKTAKETKWHTDMLLNKSNNRPVRNKNSQEPNTPVMIFTFGGKKRIFFGRGEHKKTIDPDSTFYMEQCDSRVHILHWDDEKFSGDIRKKFFHCSALHPDNTQGVVMSLMLRHVSHELKVDKHTDRLVQPPIHNDQAEFDEKGEEWVNEEKVVRAQLQMAAQVKKYYGLTNN